MYGTDPVNLSTGNFVTSEKVFNVTGVGDQNMDLTLAYNALDGRASQVGNGWNFAFGSRVQRFADGSLLATLADGQTRELHARRLGWLCRPSAGGQASLADTVDGVALTFPDHTSLEFTVDEVTGYGELTRAVDRQGNAIHARRMALAPTPRTATIVFPPLTSITDQAGQTIAVTSTAQGRITAFTHPDGRVWTLGYDATGNLTSVKDGAGRTRSFAYNGKGLLSVVTGADGVQEVTNTYDDVDRVVTQTDGAGSVRTIAYGADHSTTLTDALGNASTIDHNAKGQATASHDAGGGVTRHRLRRELQPDHLGRRERQHLPVDLRRVRPGPDEHDARSARPRATRTTPRATSRRSRRRTSDGGTATTSFVLNSDGRAVETHLPDGTVTYATYNANGDVTSMTDALRQHHDIRVRRARQHGQGHGRAGRHDHGEHV